MLGALVVLFVAALVAPVLTSAPNRDETALETATNRGDTSATVRLDDNPVDASIENPADEGDGVAAADPADGPATTVDEDTTVTSGVEVDESGATVTTATVGARSTTTTTTVRGSSTTTVAPSTTAPSANCTTDTAAAATISTSLAGERSSQGLPGLVRSAAIDDVAQTWACRMAAEGMRHNPDYGPQVFAACGGCSAVAENIGNNPTAEGAWAAWMASDTHLKNISTNRAGQHGIGAARSSSGQLFVVHDFAWD